MVLDIIIIAVIVFTAIIGFKRGIVKTVYGILCLIVAGVLACLGGRLIAEAVYNNFILNSITESIKSSFESATVNSSQISQGVFNSIPGFLGSVLESQGINQKGFSSFLDSASVHSEKAAVAAVNKVISPVIISFLSAIFIFILFVLLLLLFKLVIGRFIIRIVRLPVLKQINAVLGAVFGICEGVIIVILAIILIKMGTTFSENSLISKGLIDSSYLFNSVYNWDFIHLLSGAVDM